MGRKTARDSIDGAGDGDGSTEMLEDAIGSAQPGMNPMMMSPMMMCGMNPMMMNPMMMMMMMGRSSMMGMMQSNMQAMQAGTAGSTIVDPPKIVDPKVKALCRDFGIDDETCSKLHDAMKDREDYDEDIVALHKVMERATKGGKKPLEAMLTQIRSIRAGRFAGKDLLDEDIWAFIEKYGLDDRVMNRLIQILKIREFKAKKREILRALDDRLSGAQQPTGLGLLVRLLEGLEETGRLPSPPRRLGGSGTFHATGTFLHPNDRSRKGKGRSKSENFRSRSWGSRSRSRDRR